VTDQPQSETPAQEEAPDQPAALKPDGEATPPADPPTAAEPAEAPTAVEPVDPPTAVEEPAEPPPAAETPPPDAAVPPPPPVPPLASDPNDASGGLAATIEERPELAAGAAFAGGLILALILKRLAR
jgi:hypothetical protein